MRRLKRSNETHESTTDPDARLIRKGKGQESMLAYMGHVMLDAKSGIVRFCTTTLATGRAEVEAALSMARSGLRRGTKIIVDRHYDQKPFIEAMQSLGMIAHPPVHPLGPNPNTPSCHVT